MAAVAHPHPPRRTPELEITQTHADVTRDVVGDARARPAAATCCCCCRAVALFLVGLLTFLILVKDGLGLAGYTPPVFWGVYITTFVFWVGIGHAGTLISAILFLFRSPVAHGGLPLRRGDDGVRGHDRGSLPDHPHRAAVDLLLAAPLPELALPLAELQVAAGVGRVRHLHLPHGVDHVPLLRPDPRRRGGARQGDRLAEDGLHAWRRSAGRAPTTSGATTPARTSTSPRSRRRWCSRCTRWCRGTSRCRSCPAGTPRSSRPTSWPAPSSPASAWCSR